MWIITDCARFVLLFVSWLWMYLYIEYTHASSAGTVGVEGGREPRAGRNSHLHIPTGQRLHETAFPRNHSSETTPSLQGHNSHCRSTDAKTRMRYGCNDDCSSGPAMYPDSPSGKAESQGGGGGVYQALAHGSDGGGGRS